MVMVRAWGGLLAGAFLWWAIFYPLEWIGLMPAPWHFEDGSLVIDDVFASLGKVVGVVALPLAMAVTLVRGQSNAE